MDFSWSGTQQTLYEAAVEFAQRELNTDLRSRDKQSVFSRDNWKKCANFGIQGLPIPKAYGGAQDVLLTTMRVMEGLGYGCRDNGLIFALNAQMWSVQLPILTFGTEAQKAKYLPALCRGELIGAHGMSEPDSGSDAYSLCTRAERRHNGYLLNGCKTFVTNAPVADMVLVFATVDPDLGRWGITAFLIEKGMAGFRIGGDMEKMGLRTAPIGELIMEDCFVPLSNRLGAEGAGVSIFNSSMEWERSCILASQVGAMQRQLESAIHYAREREQFGQPIGKFQAVSHRIVEMKLRLETARLLLYKIGWLKDQNKSAVMEAALAKLYLSECFVESSLDAIRVHGGYGYMSEHEIERDLRDAIGGTLYSGTSDIQRNIIARLLGL